MIRLSIIVPFYGVEKYIEECICSLYDQDIPMEEYEVICVDDCSPDGSRAIVERMQKEYPTLRLLTHRENKRLGGARNTGLRNAKGQYVWFVDSDDTAYPNVLKNMLNQAESSRVDILQFDYSRGGRIWKNEKFDDEIRRGEDYLFANKSSRWYDKLCGAWRQLFNIEFLQKNELLFIENAMYEDTDYIMRAFIASDRVMYSPIVAYDYRINTESVTIAPMSPERLAWRVNLVERCHRCLHIVQTEEAKEAINQMVTNFLTSLRNEIKALSRPQRNVYIQNIDKTISECRELVNWRTWLAVRYGITIFV